MASMSYMKNWMAEMSCKCDRTHCICGYLEEIETLKKQNALMEKYLKDIDKAADDAMDVNVGAKSLMSFRWIRKLSGFALGQPDD